MSLDWLDGIIKPLINNALEDAGINDLQNLQPTKELSSSPLIRVIPYPGGQFGDNDHITFQIRGLLPLFEGVESVSMEVKVTTSRDPDILIKEWNLIRGDLKISQAEVFDAYINFGNDLSQDLITGRGALKVKSAGFGLDITLPGLNERGLVFGIDIDLPTPIPLGNSGLGLKGIGGAFAYNFIPNLLNPNSPTAKDYIDWAMKIEPDEASRSWNEGPIDETSIGIGTFADLVTMFDNGYVLLLEHIGLAFLIPGPVFVFGGEGILLRTDKAKVKGYTAVDFPSKSIASGLGVTIKIPSDGMLVDTSGTLEMFFSIEDPSAWYINFGTDTKRISTTIISDIIHAELYLMLDYYRIAFGAAISTGISWDFKIIGVIARAGAEITGVIGRNPFLLGVTLKIWAELMLRVFGETILGLYISGDGNLRTPHPAIFDVTLKYSINLPWPIPDLEGVKTFKLAPPDSKPPVIISPLLDDQIGLREPLTGRQWMMPSEENPNAPGCWPHVAIIVPFSCRVTDKTNKIQKDGEVISQNQGDYEVQHILTKLEINNITDPLNKVDEFTACWGKLGVAGAETTTAQLQLNSTDPFSWMMPHVGVENITKNATTPGRTLWQDFGPGNPESFIAEEKRFGKILFKFVNRAQLLTNFLPDLPFRVLCTDGFFICFPEKVEKVTFHLLGDREVIENNLLVRPGTLREPARVLRQIFESVNLVAATIEIQPPTDTLFVDQKGGSPLLIYAVIYHEKPKSSCDWKEKVVFKPGIYQLVIEGCSNAINTNGLPAAQPVPWNFNQNFKVDFPETLRPFIYTTTIGDSRIFDVNPDLREPPWNPTMHGFGFPIYKMYWPSVRFKVDYMSKIFPRIIFNLNYDTGSGMEPVELVLTNSSGDSYLPQVSQDWIRNHCGHLPPDQEVTFKENLDDFGPATVRLSYRNEKDEVVKLDEWACYVSKFDRFEKHMAWAGTCITVYYSPNGCSVRSPCPLPSETNISVIDRRPIRDIHINEHPIDSRIIDTDTKKTLMPPDLARETLVSNIVKNILGGSFQEYTTVPPEWSLAPSLTSMLKPLDANTSILFARFAWETGTRFSSAGDPLTGINDTVITTTIEAIIDNQGRLYALWLRSPEPIDWRRVTVSLSIKHVKGTEGCPTEYAQRDLLNLEIITLPSPDGSSAFLVGSLKDIPIFLPRGVYTLTLRFKTEVKDLHLPVLKPSFNVSEEQVIHTFVQPSGINWPVLPKKGIIPAVDRERLLKIYPDWLVVEQLRKPSPDIGVLMELLRKHPRPPYPDPPPPWLNISERSDVIEALVSHMVHLDTFSQRLDVLLDIFPKMDAAIVARDILRRFQSMKTGVVKRTVLDNFRRGG